MLKCIELDEELEYIAMKEAKYNKKKLNSNIIG